MGFFSFLTGAKAASNLADAVPKVIDSAISGIDKTFFTNEEKSDFVLKLSKQLYDNFMPRAISRRMIAAIVFILFGIFAIAALTCAILGMIDTVNAIITLAGSMKLGWLTMTIAVFYFGVWPAVNNAMGKPK